MTETEVLFTEVLNCSRPYLYLNKDMVLPKDKVLVISSVLKRRVLGEPIEYILGKADFMGLEFKVNKDVLIPRPETEILVETVINLVRSSQSLTTGQTGIVHSKKILELGTGSGCISVSLSKFLDDVKVTAVDISKPALKIAGENAVLQNVADKIDFIEGDLFNTYDLPLTTYDLIVTNPPYIPTEAIERLQPEVKSEPRIALDGGIDGMGFYRKIIEQSSVYLKKGGLLVMEMGFGQKEKIENLFRYRKVYNSFPKPPPDLAAKCGVKTAGTDESPKIGDRKSSRLGGIFLQIVKDFEIINIVKDYNGINRVIVAKIL